MTLEAIKYSKGKLSILDQLLLPTQTQYIDINNTDDGWAAIKKMQVRGAPAIAIVGCLSLAVEMLKKDFASPDELSSFISERLDYLVTARPTAVNMGSSATHFKQRVTTLLEDSDLKVEDFKMIIIKEIEKMLEADRGDNIALAKYGAMDIMERCSHRKARVLTHCNTGSLATAGYGTALGIHCWNPAFDVTPAELITGGIITEHGVFKPSQLQHKLKPFITKDDTV
ncbi:methylthioribose-1-phosphate isomerase-like [Argopecten irradians]|uniref:methylthioribose-1-phosphate isomerase-like n=1 Tax=Argopecten irradians TaxID=31199 RepID=UPI003718920C